MKCKKCDSDVESTDLYCRKCGTFLKGEDETTIVGLSQGETKQFIDAHIESFKREVRYVESETVDRINERTEKTLNGYFKMISIAFVLAVPILGFFGYSAYSDFQHKLESAANDVYRRLEAMDDKVRKTDSIVSLRKLILDGQFNSVNTSLDAFDRNKSKIESITKYQETARAMLKSISDNEGKTTERLREVDHLRTGFGKIMNSVYEIVIQTSALDEHDEAGEKLIGVLKAQGFKIHDDNVLKGVGVDKREVIYYNRETEERARYIASILTDSMNLATRAYRIENTEINPSLIMVKLRQN